MEELVNEVVAHLAYHQRAPTFLRICGRLEVSVPIDNGRPVFSLYYPNPEHPDGYEKVIKYEISNIEGVAQIMYATMQMSGHVEPRIEFCDDTSGKYGLFEEPVLGVWKFSGIDMESMIPKLKSILKTLLGVV